MATKNLTILLLDTQRVFVEEKIKKQQLELLRQEIQKGADDIREGRFTTLETSEDYEQFEVKTIKRDREKFAKNKRNKQISRTQLSFIFCSSVFTKS